MFVPAHADVRVVHIAKIEDCRMTDFEAFISSVHQLLSQIHLGGRAGFVILMFIGVLLILVICIIVGVVRKVRGGTFFPASPGDEYAKAVVCDC
jgi:hypothetical protein